jgi:hypothetical protein
MRHGRLQLHLDPSWLVRVKRFVRLGGGHQRLGLRENLCGIYRAAPHKVDQHGDIAAVVAIPHLDRQIPNVPAFASTSTLQESDNDGASPGCQFSPFGFAVWQSAPPPVETRLRVPLSVSKPGHRGVAWRPRRPHRSPVYSDASRQSKNHLDRIFGLKIDDLCAMCLGHLQS